MISPPHRQCHPTDRANRRHRPAQQATFAAQQNRHIRHFDDVAGLLHDAVSSGSS
jgi:hypothetical protein